MLSTDKVGQPSELNQFHTRTANVYKQWEIPYGSLNSVAIYISINYEIEPLCLITGMTGNFLQKMLNAIEI